VNTLLENSRKTSEKDLSIQRYAVIPLSPNSGLIGWVPNCDTLHALICEYRDARKVCLFNTFINLKQTVYCPSPVSNWFFFLVQIFLNQEHRLMLAFAPDYDHLPLIAKVEVFQHALNNTEGNDLGKVLSCSSAQWAVCSLFSQHSKQHSTWTKNFCRFCG
jgi:serine/threonine-protein kinase mTOR